MKNRILIVFGVPILVMFLIFSLRPLFAMPGDNPASNKTNEQAMSEEREHPSAAGERMHGRKGPQGEPFDIEEITKDINVTKEQKEKLKEEKDQHRKKIKSLQEKLHSLRNALMNELDKPSSDKAKLNSISTKMKNMMSEMMDERLNGALKIKDILTPDQYKMFVEKRKEHVKEMEKKFHKHENAK